LLVDRTLDAPRQVEVPKSDQATNMSTRRGLRGKMKSIA
jgi:hypothetical protein